jgi:hypothetical protein
MQHLNSSLPYRPYYEVNTTARPYPLPDRKHHADSLSDQQFTPPTIHTAQYLSDVPTKRTHVLSTPSRAISITTRHLHIPSTTSIHNEQQSRSQNRRPRVARRGQDFSCTSICKKCLSTVNTFYNRRIVPHKARC